MSHATAPETVVDELAAAGIPHELIRHVHTTSAAAEARALGLPADKVAKTLVLSTHKGLVRALVPASERLDLNKVRELLDDPDASLLSEDGLEAAYPEFELGAVPPFGGARHERLLVDLGVCEAESVVFEAGTHDASVRVPVRELVAHESATVADISRD